MIRYCTFFLTSLFYFAQCLAQTVNPVIDRTTIDSFKLNLAYAQSLSSKADFYLSIGNYDKALQISEEKLFILESISEYDSLDYSKSFAELGVFYGKLGLIEKGFRCHEKALALLSKPLKSSTYRYILSTICGFYLKNGKYDEAERLVKMCLSTFDGDMENPSYYGHLTNLANCYYYKGNYKASISILNEALSFEEKESGVNSLRYASILKSLALSYSHMGKLRDAIMAQEKSLDIYKQYYGIESVEYASSLSFSGHLLLLVGEKEKAFSTEEIAARIIKEVIGTDNVMYLNVLRSLSFACDNNDRKFDLLKEIRNILDKKIYDGIPSYISAMCDLAEDFSMLGKTNEVNNIKQSLLGDSIVENYLKRNPLSSANYLHTMATCLCNNGNYKESIKLEMDAIDIFRKMYGEDVTKYENSILNLFSCYINQKDTMHLFSILKDTNILEVLKNEISPNILQLTSNVRSNYWKQFSKIFSDLIPIMAVLSNDPFFVCETYDLSALFSKGMLLKTESSLQSLINSHGDATLLEKYNKMLENYGKLEKLYDKSEIDSVQSVIYIQEDEIRQRLDQLGILNDIQVSWKDIQKKLEAKDIAIEFITYDIDTCRQFNAALLLRCDYPTPQIVTIGSTDQLEEYIKNNQVDSLYSVLWKPIEKYLDGIENIYFSPSGKLNFIPMEYLQSGDGFYMCEKYNIHRLSSTQKLLSKKPDIQYHKAVLYGGLNYDMNLANKPLVSNEIDILYSKMDRGLKDSLSSRNGFEPLTNTLTEVREISKILDTNNVKCVVYNGFEGVEESFKQISGAKYDIIHLSTHGMYVAVEDIKKTELAKSLRFIEPNNMSFGLIEDKALARSFIVMSGGNMLAHHLIIPDGRDDGILTAQEIANMDLFGADMVVLSACQTGLGDINSEGVYGLQRGFKKAGVNTILMSLNKVDDEATKILMVEFYKNLMSGKNKHLSLKDAQKHLRQVDNRKYDKPEYWASFIMLDGLN